MGMSVVRRRFVDTDRIERLYDALDGREVVWGWTDQSQDYPDGTSIIMVAVVNNFGIPSAEAPKGPDREPRPILSLSFDRHIDDLEALSDAINTVLLSGKVNDIDSSLRAIGQKATVNLKKDFGNIGPMPALASSTIAAKGHSTIWIDSGHAKAQVNWQIRVATNL